MDKQCLCKWDHLSYSFITSLSAIYYNYLSGVTNLNLDIDCKFSIQNRSKTYWYIVTLGICASFVGSWLNWHFVSVLLEDFKSWGGLFDVCKSVYVSLKIGTFKKKQNPQNKSHEDCEIEIKASVKWRIVSLYTYEQVRYRPPLGHSRIGADMKDRR